MAAQRSDIWASFPLPAAFNGGQRAAEAKCKIRKSEGEAGASRNICRGNEEDAQPRWFSLVLFASGGASASSVPARLCGHGHGNDATRIRRTTTFRSFESVQITANLHSLDKYRIMNPQSTGIAHIPVEVLIDNILPFCEVNDVFSLGCTNKYFALVTMDDMFWKRRSAVDYNFTGSDTARRSGWKFIYKRLRNPRVFVWGYVIFSFHHVTRVLIRLSMRPRAPLPYIHPEKRTKADLGCPTSRRRPSRMSLFQSSFTFQVSAWSAWQ